MLALTPLAGPECRWAVARLWVFVLRWIAALVILSVVLVTSWFCWFSRILDSAYMPGSVLRISLTIVVGLTLTFVLLLAPAVLAGSFAGDSERGKLGILLSARVSAGEIVFSRFVSRLCQVGVIAASGLPGVCLLAAYCGIGLRSLAVLLLLTAAVASGIAGMALSFSVLFNRARDALIGTYAVGLSLLFLPVLCSVWISVAIAPWFRAMNPFSCLSPLIEYSQLGPAWQSILIWSVLALTGVLTASWLLRPTYLWRAGGKGSIARRRRHVPPLGDCPVRWKELYIEANKDFGRLVRVIGQFTLLLMLGGSTLLLALFVWSSWDRQSPETVEYVLETAAGWIGTILFPMSWLIQWAVGIRAAAGIAGEKERGTWDALMMTPLDGGQIVKAKMFESFYSLRWFLAATMIVWFLGVLLEAVDFYGFATIAIRTVVYVGFMSAVGVWSSLFATTSSRAITLTLAIWLAGKILFAVAAVLLVLVAMLMHYLVWRTSEFVSGRTSGIAPQPLMSFDLAMTIFELALCVGTGILIAWYCHARFDRLAGRCPARPMPVRVQPT